MTILFMFLASILFLIACMVRMTVRLCRSPDISAVSGSSGEMDAAGHELIDELHAQTRRAGMDDEALPASRAGTMRGPQSLYQNMSAFQRLGLQKAAHMTAVWTDLVQRSMHSQLILAAIFYLRLTTLAFQSFVCERLPAPTAPTDSESSVAYGLYLVADGQTVCFEGEHIATLVGSILVVLLLTIGFLLSCFILLSRAFLDEESTGVLGWLYKHCSILRDKSKRRFPKNTVVPAAAAAAVEAVEMTNMPASPSQGGWVDESRVRVNKAAAAPVVVVSPVELAYQARLRLRQGNTLGFLFLSYRPSCYFGAVLLMLSSACIAAINVFVSAENPLPRFFAFGLVWATQLFLMSLYLPFDSLSLNVRNVLVGFITLAHSAVFLSTLR